MKFIKGFTAAFLIVTILMLWIVCLLYLKDANPWVALLYIILSFSVVTGIAVHKDLI